MKRSLKSILFLAAAAIALSSCSDTDDIIVNNSGGVITVNAECPSVGGVTRTGIDISEVNPATGKHVVKPVWKADDCLTAFYDMASGPAKLTSAPLAGDTAKASFSFNNLNLSNSSFLMMAHGADGYDHKRNVLTATIKPQVLRPNSFDGSNDVLVSEIINPSDINTAEPIDVRMKRITSMMRIKITDNTTTKVKQLKDAAIQMIQLSPKVRYFQGNTLCGKFEYDFAEDTVKVVEQQQEIRWMFDPEVPYYADMEDTYVYASVMPAVFTKGTVMMFYIVAKNETMRIDKQITLTEDLKFEPGKITTINFIVNDGDVAVGFVPDEDPEKEPVVDGTTITMKEPGRLTLDLYSKVYNSLKTNGTLKIVGGVNGRDLEVMHTFDLAPRLSDNLTLDLSEMNIVGDGTYYENKLENLRCKVKSDVLTPCCIIDGRENFTHVILPESVTEIESGGVYLPYISSLTVGSKVKKIAEFAILIQLGTSKLDMIKFKAPKSIVETYDEWSLALTEFGCKNLVLHSSWKPFEPVKQNNVYFWCGGNFDNIQYFE